MKNRRRFLAGFIGFALAAAGLTLAGCPFPEVQEDEDPEEQEMAAVKQFAAGGGWTFPGVGTYIFQETKDVEFFAQNSADKWAAKFTLRGEKITFIKTESGKKWSQGYHFEGSGSDRKLTLDKSEDDPTAPYGECSSSPIFEVEWL